MTPDFQCIGKDKSGARCENRFQPTPENLHPHPDHPNWPYLCSDCANTPAINSGRNSHGIVLERKIS